MPLYNCFIYINFHFQLFPKNCSTKMPRTTLPRISRSSRRRRNKHKGLKIFSANLFSMWAATAAHLCIFKEVLAILYPDLNMDDYIGRRSVLDHQFRRKEEEAFLYKIEHYERFLRTNSYDVVCFQELPRVINDPEDNPSMSIKDDVLRDLFIKMLNERGYDCRYDGRGALVGVKQGRFTTLGKLTVKMSKRFSVPLIYAKHYKTNKVYCFGSVHMPFNMARDRAIQILLKRQVQVAHQTNLDIAIELSTLGVIDPSVTYLAGDFNSVPEGSIGPDCVTGGPIPPDKSAIDRLLPLGPDALRYAMTSKVVVPLVDDMLPGQHTTTKNLDNFRERLVTYHSNKCFIRRDELLARFVDVFLEYLPETLSDHASVEFRFDNELDIEPVV